MLLRMMPPENGVFFSLLTYDRTPGVQYTSCLRLNYLSSHCREHGRCGACPKTALLMFPGFAR